VKKWAVYSNCLFPTKKNSKTPVSLSSSSCSKISSRAASSACLRFIALPVGAWRMWVLVRAMIYIYFLFDVIL
jgi:hypothetical protein